MSQPNKDTQYIHCTSQWLKGVLTSDKIQQTLVFAIAVERKAAFYAMAYRCKWVFKKHMKGEQPYCKGDKLPKTLACIQMDGFVDLCDQMNFSNPPALLIHSPNKGRA